MLCPILFELYQIEESVGTNSRTVVAKNKDLDGLEERVHNQALDIALLETE